MPLERMTINLQLIVVTFIYTFYDLFLINEFKNKENYFFRCKLKQLCDENID
jgi:hypothetical protein